MDLDDISIDVKAEVDGVWCKFDDETEFLIARMNNKNYRTKLDVLNSEYKEKHDGKAPTGEAVSEIFILAVSSTIVLDWKGLKKAGKELKYSQKSAKKILGDENLKELLHWISNESIKRENYRLKQAEQDVK